MHQFLPYYLKRFHVYTLVLFLCCGQQTIAQKTGAMYNDPIFEKYASVGTPFYDSTRPYFVI